jgi:hypothetical protein
MESSHQRSPYMNGLFVSLYGRQYTYHVFIDRILAHQIYQICTTRQLLLPSCRRPPSSTAFPSISL